MQLLAKKVQTASSPHGSGGLVNITSVKIWIFQGIPCNIIIWEVVLPLLSP